MNLNSRLKKLENKFTAKDSPFCVCFPQYSETYLQYSDALLIWEEKHIPDVCPKCDKPTNPPPVVLGFTSLSAKERCPEEFAKGGYRINENGRITKCN